jgi:hypothetical protein
VYRVLVGKPEGKDHWRDPDLGARRILRWFYRKWDVGFWNELSWLRIERQVESTCECGNVPSLS